MIVDIAGLLEGDKEVVVMVPGAIRAVPARSCNSGAVHLVSFQSAKLETTCHLKPAQQRSCQRHIRLLFSGVEPRRDRESPAIVCVGGIAFSIETLPP